MHKEDTQIRTNLLDDEYSDQNQTNVTHQIFIISIIKIPLIHISNCSREILNEEGHLEKILIILQNKNVLENKEQLVLLSTYCKGISC